VIIALGLNGNANLASPPTTEQPSGTDAFALLLAALGGAAPRPLEQPTPTTGVDPTEPADPAATDHSAAPAAEPACGFGVAGSVPVVVPAAPIGTPAPVVPDRADLPVTPRSRTRIDAIDAPVEAVPIHAVPDPTVSDPTVSIHEMPIHEMPVSTVGAQPRVGDPAVNPPPPGATGDIARLTLDDPVDRDVSRPDGTAGTRPERPAGDAVGEPVPARSPEIVSTASAVTDLNSAIERTGAFSPRRGNSPAGDTPLTTSSSPAVDAASSLEATAVPGVAPTATRAESIHGGVAPVALGRLVAATVPQLRGASNDVRLSVRLDPPSLGQVTVDISTRDGAVHVVVRPSESSSAGVLDAQRSAVGAALANAGFELGGFDVRAGDRRDAPRPSRRVASIEGTDVASPATDLPSDDGALRL
jgi:flagellar hook-length control protein FliK